MKLSKQFSQHSVHCHSGETAAIRTGMLEHRMKEIAYSRVVFALPSEWLSRHKPFQKKLSHLLSIYTCLAKADSLFTQLDQTGLQRTRLARGKYQSKHIKNSENKMEITHLCNTLNPLCTLSFCLFIDAFLWRSHFEFWSAPKMFENVHMTFAKDFMTATFWPILFGFFWLCLSNLQSYDAF